MRNWRRWVRRPKLLLTLASLFAAYLLLGGYFLPRYLEQALPEMAAKALQRTVTLGAVRINPLLFRVELVDLALAETDGRPIARLRRLLVDFETSSLARRAWTFSDIAIEGLEVNANIAPDGRFNLAELSAGEPKEKGADPGAAPPRLLLQRFAIVDSSFTFSDRSGARPIFATVRPLGIELRDLSTLPERQGTYSIGAQLPAGATLAWRGEISLQPIQSRGEITLRGLRPASIWRFFQDELRLAEPGGEVDLGLRYTAAYAGGTPQATVENITLAARDLALSLQGAKEPFFSLQSAKVAEGKFDLAQRELQLPSIELRGGVVRAQAGEDGVLDLQKLAPDSPPAAQAPPAPADPAARPWRVKLDSVRLGELALQYRDLSRVAPLALGVGALDLSLSAALQTGAGATQVAASDIAIRVSRIRMGPAAAAEPVVGVDSVVLEGGSFDLGARRIEARRLSVKGGSASLVREADGRLPLVELARPKQATPAAEKAAGAPWRLALDAFQLDGWKIALADHGTTPPLAYDIESLSLGAKNVRNEGKAPIRVEAALRVAQGGELKASGEVATSGERATARVTLDRLSLQPLQALAASRTSLVLGAGDASAALQVSYRGQKDGPELRVGGTASVDNLLLKGATDGAPLLEWGSIAASGIDFSLGPDRLAIADVAVRGLGARIAIARDRKVNLAEALAPPGGAPKPAPAPAPAAAPAPSAPASSPFPVSVERIRVEKAAVDFSDLSLVLPFAAKIQELDGDLLGISTDAASRALVKLDGRVGEFGLARVEGSLATSDPKAFLDLRVDFRNVAMPTLSPYSATFAGRRIASGTLTLDLQYRIDNGALAGDNKVVLDKFTLGERVEAPGATNLPLDLAIALLTDSDGRIAVAVPVKGNVNDPQFAYGHLVWQAIVTVISNIVTAPFRALFGGGSGGGDAEQVAFDAGRAALLPPEREKLKRLAEALGKRPKLKVVVQGQHGAADGPALRRRDVAAAISQRLGRADAAEPQPVNARDGRTQLALEALYAERASVLGLVEFIEATEKARGKPVERIRPDQARAGRASPDGAFYDALLQRLHEAVPLPGDALDKLAAARAGAVVDHLLKDLAVPAARVQRKDAAAAGGERASLSLDIAN